MPDALEELRRKVAISSRILAMEGLVRDSTGHVSARIPGSDEMFIRCRGGDECGLLFTGLHNIRRTDFDGNGPDLGTEHASPNETAIHGELYRARPEVQAVVHAHPLFMLRCGITDVEFRPIFGAFDPSALRIVLDGVPVFKRSITVSNAKIGAEMIQAMGNRNVVLMRGHGITVTAPSVEEATTLALRFEQLAHLMWDIATSGRNAPDISPEDMEVFKRMGGRDREPRERSGWSALPGVETWGWKMYVKKLERSYGLPDDEGVPASV